MKIKKAVILCGGLATRMLPLTKVTPKELFPLGTKPILQYLLEDCAKVKIEEVILVISENKRSIIDYFERNEVFEQKLISSHKMKELEIVRSVSDIIPVTYIIQHQPKGTMDALLTAWKMIENEPFLLLFGDEYVLSPTSVVEQMLHQFASHPTNLLALKEVDPSQVYKYGIIVPEKKQGDYCTISHMVEKPKVEEAPSNISYIGPAILMPEIFQVIDNYIKNCDKNKIEYVVTDAFIELAHMGKLSGVHIHGTRLDMGSKIGFIQSNVLMALEDHDLKVDMEQFLRDLVDKMKWGLDKVNKIK